MFNDSNTYIGTFNMVFKLKPEGEKQLEEILYIDPEPKEIDSPEMKFSNGNSPTALRESKNYVNSLTDQFIEPETNIVPEGLPDSPTKKQVKEEMVEDLSVKEEESPENLQQEITEHPNPR